MAGRQPLHKGFELGTTPLRLDDVPVEVASYRDNDNASQVTKQYIISLASAQFASVLSLVQPGTRGLLSPDAEVLRAHASSSPSQGRDGP